MNILEKTVNTPKCGTLNVTVQGSKEHTESAILTVHDMGCNRSQYTQFLQRHEMEHIVNRFMWIHVELPGQGTNAPDLPEEFTFPTMENIAEDLIHVLNHLDLKNVVLFGEGAGANILARFAIRYDQRVLGAVLIHCVGTTDNFLAKANTKVSVTNKLKQGMNSAALEYLIRHRFGLVKESSHPDLIEEVETFTNSLNEEINAKNLTAFITAYSNRSAIKEKIGSINCPVLFLTGSLAAHAGNVLDLHYTMQKALLNDTQKRSKPELVQIADVSNALIERPAKVAECLQYFLQGLGLGCTIVSPIISASIANERELFKRMHSMEIYDKPKGRSYYRGFSESSVDNMPSAPIQLNN